MIHKRKKERKKKKGYLVLRFNDKSTLNIFKPLPANPFYICKWIELKLISLHTNGFKYFNQTLIILFNVIHSFQLI